MTSLSNAAALPLLALVGTTLLSSTAIADSSLPGPYPVAQRNVTVTRPGGSTFTAQLRYPATSTSSTAPVAPAAMPAPAISFGHGFLSPVDIYDSTMDHLASHGYIVIATTSGGELFPNHANYALDMRSCLTHLEQQDLVKSSFLFGAVDETAFGISGHSMGGGASALAAGADARIKALATLAAAETNPSSSNAMLTVQRPSLFIVGSQDSIVTPATTQNQYNNSDAPRQFTTIAGGSHCGFVDSAIIGCDSGSLARAEQLAKTRALLLDFFDAHLRDDPAAFSATWGSGTPLAGTTRTRDARVSASLGQTSLSGAAGSVLETTLVATNAGPDATAIAPRALAASVDVAIDPPTSAVLAAGQSAVFTIRAAAPVAATESVQIEVVRVRDDAGVPLALAVEFTAGNPTDLDGDGSVGATDLAALLNAWGACAGCAADLDADGSVGAADLAVLLGSWSN
jgi:dienelactone hydrolase